MTRPPYEVDEKNLSLPDCCSYHQAKFADLEDALEHAILMLQAFISDGHELDELRMALKEQEFSPYLRSRSPSAVVKDEANEAMRALNKLAEALEAADMSQASAKTRRFLDEVAKLGRMIQ